MATPGLLYADRVQETSTTTGTGTLTLAGAVTGYQAFSSAFVDQQQVIFCIQDLSNNAWEVSRGTYTLAGTTLSRDVVLASSNSGSLVNFASGTKQVFCVIAAETFADMARVAAFAACAVAA